MRTTLLIQTEEAYQLLATSGFSGKFGGEFILLRMQGFD
jgi:hypothetical protein